MNEKNVKNGEKVKDEININFNWKNIKTLLYYSSIFFVIGLFYSFFYSIGFFPDFSMDSIIGIVYISLIMGGIILIAILFPIFISIPLLLFSLKSYIKDDVAFKTIKEEQIFLLKSSTKDDIIKSIKEKQKEVSKLLSDVLFKLILTIVILAISIFFSWFFTNNIFLFLIPLLLWFLFDILKKEYFAFILSLNPLLFYLIFNAIVIFNFDFISNFIIDFIPKSIFNFIPDFILNIVLYFIVLLFSNFLVKEFYKDIFTYNFLYKEYYMGIFNCNRLKKYFYEFFLYYVICIVFISYSLLVFDFYQKGMDKPELTELFYISFITILIFILNSIFIFCFDSKSKFKYYLIYISLFLSFFLLLYIGFFQFTSNLIAERFKFGNISNASIIVDQKTCNEANLLKSGYCEPKNGSGIINRVTIVSRIGEQYLLEKENKRLVLQKNQVIMWTRSKEPKGSFLDKAIEISNFVKHINMN